LSHEGVESGGFFIGVNLLVAWYLGVEVNLVDVAPVAGLL